MSAFESVLDAIEGAIWAWVGVPALVLTAIGFTVATRGMQFRRIPDIFRVIRDKADTGDDGEPGDSAFQSFCISAASRVGTGNIVGVAVAIGAGGPAY
ncbi:MAG: sodium:alanine symporter family protein [Mycobacterium sp.]|nr:sodium:alanine symporter family protein [Mycobacterium sp.]